MTDANKPGKAVQPDESAGISGGASEGDCLAPGTPDPDSTSGSPWWRSLQDALGNMLR